MTNLAHHSIATIILAAGRGTRMGARPKLLLPWRGGKPLLWHTATNALSFQPAEVVVVVRPDLAEMIPAISDLPIRCVPNPRYEEGMATSLMVGIQALGGDIEAALVMLGDEPSIEPLIIEKLVETYLREQKPITIPQYGDQVGPPTLFARQIFPGLMKLQGDIGGRQIVSHYPEMVCRVPFPEGMRPHDIDTEQDYRSIL